ncbi:MAG TPA: hypothetical protein VIJ39_10730 [Solirubrobacteraceae bacterium]
MPTRATVVGLAAILGLALAVQVASADPASRETDPVLTHEHVLHIALVEAKESQDPHPKRIEMATGSLSAALRVMEPKASAAPAGTEVVDLVVMRGYFHINAPHPRGHPIAPGKVLCLVINAHTGFVQARSLGSEVPALSHLGRVTRLR